MRFCHIVPSLEQQHGGPSNSVRHLCGALARAGHEVQLFSTHPDAPGTGQTTEEGPLRIVVFRREFPARVCVSPGLRDAVAESRAEIIHHHSLWLRTLHYAHERTRRGDALLVISPRGMMSPWAWHQHRWRKQVARIFLHPGALLGAAGWHATSEPEATEIKDKGYVQPVCVAPNGIDKPDPSAIAAARAYWHQACPDTATRRTALFYSRFHRKKRVLELIDLWLRQAPQDWLLLIVGIPQEYTVASLERYVQNSSGAGRIRVYAGVDRPPPYAVASLFLLPSHNENFGLVVAEALAHGVCALVTDSTPWSALGTERLGWCVPWSKYDEALVAATAEKPAELSARGARAAAWVLREYSWDRAAHLLVDFYQRLRMPTP